MRRIILASAVLAACLVAPAASLATPGTTAPDSPDGTTPPAVTTDVTAPAAGVSDTSTGTPGQPGGNGGDATGFAGVGAPGDNGGAGGAGGDGGNGGNLNYTVDAKVTGDVSLTTTGGNGREGGNGGKATAGGDGNGSVESINKAGGNGGDGGAGGKGGDGGDGGDISLTVNQEITGSILLNSSGGAAGKGGVAGSGGNGGQAALIDSAFAAKGGDGGDGAPPGLAGAGSPNGTPGTTTPPAANGTPGDGGTINVVVNAKVDGSINATDPNGIVNVRLNDGAQVGGTIASVSGSAYSTLTFALTAGSHADYTQASAIIASNQASGTVTVNGNSYSWSGFDNLVNLLKDVADQSPTANVTISVSNGGGAGASSDELPRFLSCQPKAVKAFIRADGKISINTTLPDQGNKRFAVGLLNGLTFEPAPGLGWTVEVANDGRRTLAKVFDHQHNLAGTCVIEGPPLPRA